jgi:hypothetical protein
MLTEDGALKVWLITLIDLPISLWQEYIQSLKESPMSLKKYSNSTTALIALIVMITINQIIDDTYSVAVWAWDGSQSYHWSAFSLGGIDVHWNEAAWYIFSILAGYAIGRFSSKALLTALAMQIILNAGLFGSYLADLLPHPQEGAKIYSGVAASVMMLYVILPTALLLAGSIVGKIQRNRKNNLQLQQGA